MPRRPSPSTRAHKRQAPERITFAVLTVSTRGAKARSARAALTGGDFEDRSGDLLAKGLAGAGHREAGRALVADGVRTVRAGLRRLLARKPDLVAVTGGTGLAPKDLTIEAVRPLFDREVTGFGPLFLLLSHEEIGAAALLSRATAGVIGESLVVLLPGSPNAVRLALEKILLPEGPHIVKHLREG